MRDDLRLDQIGGLFRVARLNVLVLLEDGYDLLGDRFHQDVGRWLLGLCDGDQQCKEPARRDSHGDGIPVTWWVHHRAPRAPAVDWHRARGCDGAAARRRARSCSWRGPPGY